METATNERSIGAALSLSSHRCVTLIGGGGKTTTLLSLAVDAVRTSRTALLTTTTHMWPPQDVELLLAVDVPRLEEAVRARLPDVGLLALGSRCDSQGKVVGIEPDCLCCIAGSGAVDVVLCEADGSAGRSLKAHRVGEPVVPGCTSLLVTIAGIDAVGQTASDDVVHRLDLFEHRFGLQRGQSVQSVHVASALYASARFAPHGVPVAYVINKVDSPRAVSQGRTVMRLLYSAGAVGTCLLTSWGAVVERYDLRSEGWVRLRIAQ